MILLIFLYICWVHFASTKKCSWVHTRLFVESELLIFFALCLVSNLRLSLDCPFLISFLVGERPFNLKGEVMVMVFFLKK
jgi:hypothetical protein